MVEACKVRRDLPQFAFRLLVFLFSDLRTRTQPRKYRHIQTRQSTRLGTLGYIHIALEGAGRNFRLRLSVTYICVVVVDHVACFVLSLDLD